MTQSEIQTHGETTSTGSLRRGLRLAAATCAVSGALVGGSIGFGGAVASAGILGDALHHLFHHGSGSNKHQYTHAVTQNGPKKNKHHESLGSGNHKSTQSASSKPKSKVGDGSSSSSSRST